MFEVLLYLFLFIIALIAYIRSTIPEEFEVECDCGKYEKCVSKITITGKGRMSRDPKELLQCGKVEKQMEKLDKLFKDE